MTPGFAVIVPVGPGKIELRRFRGKIGGVDIVSAAASSKLALTWLSEEKYSSPARILKILRLADFNLPFIHKESPS
jgi:hypothetical protein